MKTIATILDLLDFIVFKLVFSYKIFILLFIGALVYSHYKG